MIEDEKVTITQATEMGFGSRSTLMRLLRKGWIHSTKVGGKHLLDVAELARVRGSRDTERECYLRLAKAIARDSPSIDPDMIKYLVREMNYIGWATTEEAGAGTGRRLRRLLLRRGRGLVVMSQVTLREAIDMGYASRATIMRRKADGLLHPVKDARGRLHFDTVELDDVFRSEGLKGRELTEFVRLVRAEAPRLTSEQALDLIKYHYDTCVYNRDRKRKRKRPKGSEGHKTRP